MKKRQKTKTKAKKPKTIHKQRQVKWKPPALRFSPTAWAKLLFLRDYGDTEVGGFGISAVDDLLLVEDFHLVRQTCSWAHVSFDDESVADFFEDQVDAGRSPEQFARVWIHTHPGDCARPSGKDEQTFTRVFGNSTWAVMFILARDGQVYARLRFHVGPSGECEIPVEVDYGQPFAGSDHEAWEHQYQANIFGDEKGSQFLFQDEQPIDAFWTDDDLPRIPDELDSWPPTNLSPHDDRTLSW